MNNGFNSLDFNRLSSLDLTHLNDDLPKAYPVIDTSQRDRAIAALVSAEREKLDRERRQLEAAEKIAANTEESNDRLTKIIDNQNEQIDCLRKQLTEQEQHTQLLESQFKVLKNIFASQEDGIEVEKEIMQLIRNQIDENHPLWEYVKDKGGDLAVSGIVAGAPVIYTAVKALLAANGILLP